MPSTADFVPAPERILAADRPLVADIFILMQLNNSFLHFRRKGDTLSAADLETLKKIPNNCILVPRAQFSEIMGSISYEIELELTNPDRVNSPKVQDAAKGMLASLEPPPLPPAAAAAPPGAAASNSATERAEIIRELLSEAATQMEKVMKVAWRVRSVKTYESVLIQWKHEKNPLITHLRQVSAIGAIIQLAVGDATHQDFTDVGLSGLLHDFGLLNAPKTLVERHIHGSDRFNPSEKIIYMRHVEDTLALIQGQKLVLTPGAVRIIQHHHENWDGSGFKGLTFSQIYRPARILRLADAVVSSLNNPSVRYGFYETLKELSLENGVSGKPVHDPAVIARLMADLQRSSSLAV